MSYNVKYTDQSYNVNHFITVNDGTVNSLTNLKFPGRNQPGYAVDIAENFLHLLENFASTSSPNISIGGQSVAGQLWFDTTEGVKELKVFDGTNWKPVGSVKKSIGQPTSNLKGDLWVNTATSQLFIWNDASWVPVNPDRTGSSNTSTQAATIKDNTATGIEHLVLYNYVDNNIVSIISSSEFTPKIGISGFTNIKPGINLSTSKFSGNTNYNKFWGTSEKAENLIDGTTIIPASKFLQTDKINTVSQPFTIKNSSGLYIGNEAELRLRITDNRGVLYHATPTSRLDFRVNVNSSETTLISLNSTTSKVGIGTNHFSPDSTLSVLGTGSFSGQLKITDVTETESDITGALIVSGGVVIKKKLKVSGSIETSGQITSTSIIPTTNNISNIGSIEKRFNNVYSSNFSSGVSGSPATFTGSFNGQLDGSVTGTASRLVSRTQFSMIGDVSSFGFSFDGQDTIVNAGSFVTGRNYMITTVGNTDFTLIGSTSSTINTSFVATGPGIGSGTAKELKQFYTRISTDFISTKAPLQTTIGSDELLLNRTVTFGGNDPDVYKVTKSNFLKGLALVPIGSIFPFAGSLVPSGYLLCDGSEKSRSVYVELYNIIGFTYTTGTLYGNNTFKLPDLRGRFPLGLDNMDNKDFIPSKADPGISIDAGGGPANRVGAAAASNLGNAGGLEQVTLDVSKLPNHKHTLTDTNGDQFYVTNNSSTAPPNGNQSVLIDGPAVSSSTQKRHLTTTGNINAATVGEPVSVMNPYLSINYIIYTGVY
jgi:microcystin-dependent protein